MNTSRKACHSPDDAENRWTVAKKLGGIFYAVSKGRFIYLLVVLLAYLLVSPIVEYFTRLRILYYLFMITILLASLLAISRSSAQTMIAVWLAIPMSVLVMLAYVFDGTYLPLAANAASALFILYVIVAIMKYVFRACRVTHHVIFAAVAAYLLIGVFWSLCYTVMGTLSPEAFRFPDTCHPGLTRDFTYFSFVTLTTLGYGDITPASDVARAMAFVEALIGQIYMTVLIAWLVGIFVSEKIQSDRQPPGGNIDRPE